MDNIEVIIARLEGKIDGLGAKLDANKEALLARIESGDRESMQQTRINHERLQGLTEKVTNLESKYNSFDTRLGATEKWQARVFGVAVGASIFGGGVAAAIVRVTGTG